MSNTINNVKADYDKFCWIVEQPWRNARGEAKYLENSNSNDGKKILWAFDLELNVISIHYWCGRKRYLSVERRLGNGDWETPEISIEELEAFLHEDARPCRFMTTKRAL
jgi:hypothetical protein